MVEATQPWQVARDREHVIRSIEDTCAEMWIMAGMRKDRVFPEPVLAIPMVSFPRSEIGQDWAWIDVGLMYKVVL